MDQSPKPPSSGNVPPPAAAGKPAKTGFSRRKKIWLALVIVALLVVLAVTALTVTSAGFRRKYPQLACAAVGGSLTLIESGWERNLVCISNRRITAKGGKPCNDSNECSGGQCVGFFPDVQPCRNELFQPVACGRCSDGAQVFSVPAPR